jgi:acetyl-CoA acetyltransferase/uncharacterized OB-fold protein
VVRGAGGRIVVSGAAAGAAIAGLGMTSLGRVYGTTPRRLAASAVRAAAADAGMAVGDLDGLLICPGITGGVDVGLAAQLGMTDLSLLAVVNSFGASATMAVQTAALAVTSGAARAVACVFADTPLREGAPAGSAFGRWGDKPGGDGRGGSAPPERHGLAGLTAGYGFSSVSVWYAMAARRHMERYGTTSEQLGAIAVAQRQWAAGNPLAQYRDPITLDDHQRSRWVADPLHLLDCSLVTNGAIAVIVTSAQAAARGPLPPVHVLGWGQGHPGQPWRHGSDFGLVTGAVQAGRAAMGMARVSAADITMCQIYDCYTYTVLVTLEDYGFCAKGDGGPFAASGVLAPGGTLPVNTGGGQLSGYYMWGFTPLSEAVIQARGEGGDRQSAATDLICVSGNGGILGHHGTLILSPHPAGSPAPRTGRVSSASLDGTTAQAPSARGSRMAGQDGGVGGGVVESGGTTQALRLPDDGSAGVIRPDERSAPFFEAAARGELLVRRCEPCGQWYAPTASECTRCGDDAGQGNLSWAAAAGTGTLVSWSVVPPRGDGPVSLPAFVELAEGPWLTTALRLDVPADLGRLRAGQPVVVEFARPAEGAAYPVFRPAFEPSS